jgi:hypothetical protein
MRAARGYVYLRVQQSDGDRLWTAPVWLESTGIAPGGSSEEGISVTLAVDAIAETEMHRESGKAIYVS